MPSTRSGGRPISSEAPGPPVLDLGLEGAQRIKCAGGLPALEAIGVAPYGPKEQLFFPLRELPQVRSDAAESLVYPGFYTVGGLPQPGQRIPLAFEPGEPYV